MADQSKLGIGELLQDHQEKDAIHVAVAPAINGGSGYLYAGNHVGIISKQTNPMDYVIVDTSSAKHIGIVDPFLHVPVKEKEAFWLFLYPGSISSLRHDWTHQEFLSLEHGKDINSAEQKFAVLVDNMNTHMMDYDGNKPGYTSEDYMKVLDDIYKGSAGSICFGTNLHYDDFESNIQKELWVYYGIIRGVDVSNFTDHDFFRCAC